eukprot:TRINITY_DN43096_c0_g1_i1.p1 TRINITY_DN43096_c0_g1~~TRINITY_DN43096_c0_g1_i1.p1  ORF type:complete len:216 (+),score=29.13 TRINITY_DN43096_c0_g1_i1:81-650(+)
MAPKAAPVPFEGRIPGFDNRWNATKVSVIGKEDQLRWKSLDKQAEIMNASGEQRRTVKLQRAHSAIGPFPGCFRRVQLSPRKSASMCFLEQKLLKSSAEDPENPTMRETLYNGVSHEEQGRHEYLKKRSGTTIQHRYGHYAVTTNQAYGFQRAEGEYRASRFCHKPVMEKGFFRVNGTTTYANLPESAK